MRNRAKCKLCNEIIESFHRYDIVKCKCGEIYIEGGSDFYKAGCSDWANFIRIDDNDKEVPITVVDDPNEFKKVEDDRPPTRQEKLEMLKGMIESYERLPNNAMSNPVSNYDLAASLLLVYEILKDEDKH